jgi:sigma-E factor negative regulatory protein RseB
MTRRPVARTGLASLVCIGLCCLPFAATLGAAPDSPRQWLVRMGQALVGLNYTGTLVHHRDNEVTSIRVVHRVENGVVTERISSMDEAGREIIRRGREVTCIFPDQREVRVEQLDDDTGPASPLLRQLPGGRPFDDAHYKLSVTPGGRMADRETRLVLVRPTDRFRYGFRLWLDEATAMPLKVQIIDVDGSLEEQLLFTDLRFPTRIPDSAVEPTALISGFTRRESSMRIATAVRGEGAAGRWTARWLPPGFALSASRLGKDAEATDEPLEQLVYSDGIATVSVFIERATDGQQRVEGASRAGAANAFTRTTAGHLVTAVGEVPEGTVELVAQGVIVDSADASR